MSRSQEKTVLGTVALGTVAGIGREGKIWPSLSNGAGGDRCLQPGTWSSTDFQA